MLRVLAVPLSPSASATTIFRGLGSLLGSLALRGRAWRPWRGLLGPLSTCLAPSCLAPLPLGLLTECCGCWDWANWDLDWRGGCIGWAGAERDSKNIERAPRVRQPRWDVEYSIEYPVL